MSPIIAICVLVLIGLTYAILLKRALAETFVLAAVSVVGILYAFGLLNFTGSLLWGLFFVVAISITCIFILIQKFLKDREVFTDAQALHGILLVAGFTAFSYALNYGRVFGSWDEFSHWGSIVRYFHATNALGTTTNELNAFNLFPSYFPGTSLFQYFFTRFSRQFEEYHIYIAMNMLFFSLIMPLVKDVFSKEKRYEQGVLLLVLIMVSNVGIHLSFNTLLVDGMLGVFFGFSLVYYFYYRYENSLYGIFSVTSLLFILSLTKDIGVLLSIGVQLVIILDIIIFRRKQIRSYISKSNKTLLRMKSAALLLTPLFAIAIVQLSWSLLVQISGIESVWSIPTPNDVINLVTGDILPHQLEVRELFLNALYARPVFILSLSRVSFGLIPDMNITFVMFSIIFLKIICLYTICTGFNTESMRFVCSSLVMLLGACIYQFVLLIMYAYSFTEFEALILASYERYTHTYLMALKIFLVGIAFFEFKECRPLPSTSSFLTRLFFSSRPICSITLKCFLLLTVYAFSSVELERIFRSREMHPEFFESRQTSIAADRWRDYFTGKNLYLIVQDDNGHIMFRMRYEVFPDTLLTSRTIYNIAPERNTHWTFAVSPDEWADFVLDNEFDVVWVYRSNDYLETVYSRFFPDGVQDDMLYSVNLIDGELALIPVVHQ